MLPTSWGFGTVLIFPLLSVLFYPIQFLSGADDAVFLFDRERKFLEEAH